MKETIAKENPVRERALSKSQTGFVETRSAASPAEGKSSRQNLVVISLFVIYNISDSDFGSILVSTLLCNATNYFSD